jgi:hypothetical protein
MGCRLIKDSIKLIISSHDLRPVVAKLCHVVNNKKIKFKQHIPAISVCSKRKTHLEVGYCKMAREGGHEGGLNILYISANFLLFLKDSGSLNYKKLFERLNISSCNLLE